MLCMGMEAVASATHYDCSSLKVYLRLCATLEILKKAEKSYEQQQRLCLNDAGLWMESWLFHNKSSLNAAA